MILAACAQPTPAPVLAPAPEPVFSDLCYLVQAEAAKQPSLEVDRTPAVVKYEPKPLLAPKGDTPAASSAVTARRKVQVSVVVDTAGKADMTTFTVVETTHPLARHQHQGAHSQVDVHSGNEERLSRGRTLGLYGDSGGPEAVQVAPPLHVE